MVRELGRVWFTCAEPVGVVLAHDNITDKLKAWVRVVHGADEESDVQLVMSHGAKFPVEEAISLIKKKGSWTTRIGNSESEARELLTLLKKAHAW